jgi:WD40 repeat protein
MIIRVKPSPFIINGTKYVASCSHDQSVKIWNPLTNWELIRTYTSHTSYVYALEWINNDTLASSGLSEQTIHIWSLSSGQILRTINPNSAIIGVYCLKMLTNGVHLAAGLTYDIKIFDLKSGNLIATLFGHDGAVTDLTVSSDLLASSSSDWTVRVWNLTTYSNKFIFRGHNWTVHSVKIISPDLLASGSVDTTVKLWNLKNGSLMRSLSNNNGYIYSGVDLLNSQTLLSGSIDGLINVWNWNTSQCIYTIYTYRPIYSLAVLNPMQSMSSFLLKI